MDDLLQRATDAGLGQAEVYRVTSESEPVGFEANRLKEASRHTTSGVALRVISGGRLALSATTDPASEPALVDRVRELAPFGAEAAFELPPARDYPDVDLFDPAIENLAFDDMAQTGQTLIDAVRRDWPDLVCEASVSRAVHTFHLQNTRGVDASYRQTVYSVGIGGTLVRGEDMLMVWEGHGSSRLFGDVNWMVESVLRQLEQAREIAAAPSGGVPVVFTPRGVVAALLRPLLSGFNGKGIVTGTSPLADRMGETIIDERVSVYDDPTIPHAVGSRPCDDEGVPSARMPLVENGVLRNFLFDMQTAGKVGATTTGSAGRGLTSLPAPTSSVIDIAPGDAPADSLLDGIREGIVVERLLGAGQGNEMGGDFRANVLLGYKVENGRIVGRVKDTMIAGNVYDVLSKIEAVSDRPEWVHGGVRTPAFRCRGVEVAAAG